MAVLSPLTLLVGLWSIALLLSPVYIFDDGSPQPFHIMAAALFIPTAILFLPILSRIRDLLMLAYLFPIYTVLVNVAWFIQHPDVTFVMSSAYHLFNATLFALIVVLGRADEERVLKLSRAAIALAVAIELVVVLLVDARDHPSGGATGTFINPNQLGYWALLAFASLIALKQNRPHSLLDVAIYALALAIMALSLSRAALISSSLLVFLLFCIEDKKNEVWFAVLVAFVGVLATLWIAGGAFVMELPLLAEVNQELARKTRWDGASGRGYDRIWIFPQYLLFGAGEGHFSRFAGAPLFFNNEIHSSLGTILFSYGVIGCMLFIGFATFIMITRPTKRLMLCTPILLYGLAHNGLRFSMFWVFLALLYLACTPRKRRQTGAEQAAWDDSRALRWHFLALRGVAIERLFARRRPASAGPLAEGEAPGFDAAAVTQAGHAPSTGPVLLDPEQDGAEAASEVAGEPQVGVSPDTRTAEGEDIWFVATDGSVICPWHWQPERRSDVV